MTPLFRSIERSQTVHYWPWSRTSTSCLAVHCRSCNSSSALQLMYTLTMYQRPSRLRDYLAWTHANTSTVKYGGPASHPTKSQAARNRGAIPASGRPQWSQALHIIYYLHTHICVFGGGDIHAIFQTFVYTLSFLVPQLSYRGSTFIIPLHQKHNYGYLYCVCWTCHINRVKSSIFAMWAFHSAY